jgi:hypothetical protein
MFFIVAQFAGFHAHTLSHDGILPRLQVVLLGYSSNFHPTLLLVEPAFVD